MEKSTVRPTLLPLFRAVSKSHGNTIYLKFVFGRRTLRGVEKLGLPYIPDINSPTHPPFGCGRVFFTIDKNSHRSSTFHAFLPASLALKRKSNLHICTDTLVERLVLESLPDGTSVVRGVQMISGGGRKTVKVEQEVIMSAGPLANPQILMLRYMAWKTTMISWA